MKNKDIVKKLTDLTQLDIDAVHAYKQALDNITDDEIYRNISSFREDHIRHVEQLSILIRTYGEEPPEFTKDFKGYFIEGFTSLRSLTGTKGALKAMETNEILTNNTYKKALEEDGEEDLPTEVVELLRRNYDDEKRHLDYIKTVLESKTLE